MNNVSYYALSHQTDTQRCVDQDFRKCGNMTVDIPAVIKILRTMLVKERK